MSTERTPSLDVLTPPQRKLFLFIRRFLLDNRYAPCLREMCHALGVQESALRGHLDRLAKKGAIGRKPNVSRAVWVSDAWAAVGEATPERWVTLDPVEGHVEP